MWHICWENAVLCDLWIGKKAPKKHLGFFIPAEGMVLRLPWDAGLRTAQTVPFSNLPALSVGQTTGFGGRELIKRQRLTTRSR